MLHAKCSIYPNHRVPPILKAEFTGCLSLEQSTGSLRIGDHCPPGQSSWGQARSRSPNCNHGAGLLLPQSWLMSGRSGQRLDNLPTLPSQGSPPVQDNPLYYHQSKPKTKNLQCLCSADLASQSLDIVLTNMLSERSLQSQRHSNMELTVCNDYKYNSGSLVCKSSLAVDIY